jgi:DNA mismatch repair protein MutS
MNDGDVTPLMRQYREIKREHQDAIVLFRVGDFYEMFYEDAEVASRILAIALTSRDKDRPDPVPLCGVPHHAATGYIAKLLKAGKTVALCDQVEDPKLAKGLVRREVTRLYTPGTLVETELLSPVEANYLAALSVRPMSGSRCEAEILWGLAALDSSTGEFWIMEQSGASALASLQDELTRLEPRELLYPADLAMPVRSWLLQQKDVRLNAQDPSWFDSSGGERLLLDHFRISSLDGFGCAGLTLGIGSAGAVMRYLRETQPNAPFGHILRLRVRYPHDAMHLDAATIRNLELIKPLTEHRQASTLLSVLDHTLSAMGSRLLRDWIVRPLTHPDSINHRLDAVGELMGNLPARTRIRHALKAVQDLPRLSGRIALAAANPRDLLAVKQSIAPLPEIRTILGPLRSDLLQRLLGTWDDLADVHRLIDESILPEAPVSTRDGGIFKEGYHPDLDDLRRTCREGKTWIARLEAQERANTGIDSLKIRFNQVFGYYIEVTKANVSRIPGHYLRKQTLVNAERFTTTELKELEDRVTGADLKLTQLEQELFERIRGRLSQETPRLQGMGNTLAILDALAALAEAGAVNRYVRPIVDDGPMIDIREGRHPVIERLGLQNGFVPNDTLLDRDSNRLLILTGPNMAGKSTYLRQIALIVLMAQMGSFVPASLAHIGTVDRIFTRVGASDNLAGGQSTFMVEMAETAQILNCATERSLILLDEVGRGTSTYDGLSIAWAVAEYIQDRRTLGARTLFATHYHEMTDLARHHEGVKNYTMLVKEQNDDVLFLRKVVEGGADRSYGIHVARLAGLPASVIARAREVLSQLEGSPPPQREDESRQVQDHRSPALPLRHQILLEEVRQMDLFAITPLEALNRLADLQRRLEEHPESK